MFDILAQGPMNEVISGTAGVAVGSAAVVIVQALIKRGFSVKVGENGKPAVPAVPVVCAVHESLVKLLDERNVAIRAELTEIRRDFNDGLGEIHRRMDAILKILAERADVE